MSSPTSSTSHWVRHSSTRLHHPGAQGIIHLAALTTSWWSSSSIWSWPTLSPSTDPSSSSLFIKSVDNTTVVGLISSGDQTDYRRRSHLVFRHQSLPERGQDGGDGCGREESTNSARYSGHWHCCCGCWECTSLRTSPGAATGPESSAVSLFPLETERSPKTITGTREIPGQLQTVEEQQAEAELHPKAKSLPFLPSERAGSWTLTFQSCH